MHRPAVWPALLLASALSAACKGEVVGPAEDPSTTSDVSPPRIFGLEPAALIKVLNDTEVRFRVEDPTSSGRAPGSGVDAASVQVRLQGGTSLPLTHQRSTFTASIAELQDGPTVLDISVRDRAGNEATARFDFILDRTPPALALVANPQGAVTSGDWSTTIGLAGSVADQNGLSTSAVAFTIAHPGPNGECDPFDAPFETGTLRGKVEQSRYSLDPSGFDVRATVINGTGPNEAPRTMRYCSVLRAVDKARNAAGVAAGNVLHEAFTHDVTWHSFPFPKPTDLAGRWGVSYSSSRGTCQDGGLDLGPTSLIDVQGVGDVARLRAARPGSIFWGAISGDYDGLHGQFTGEIADVDIPDFSNDWLRQYRTWRVFPNESWDVAFDGPATAPFFVGRSRMEWAYDVAEYYDDEWGGTIPARSVNCTMEFFVRGEKLP